MLQDARLPFRGVARTHTCRYPKWCSLLLPEDSHFVDLPWWVVTQLLGVILLVRQLGGHCGTSRKAPVSLGASGANVFVLFWSVF